jgi:hypothetical protein
VYGRVACRVQADEEAEARAAALVRPVPGPAPCKPLQLAPTTHLCACHLGKCEIKQMNKGTGPSPSALCLTLARRTRSSGGWHGWRRRRPGRLGGGLPYQTETICCCLTMIKPLGRGSHPGGTHAPQSRAHWWRKPTEPARHGPPRTRTSRAEGPTRKTPATPGKLARGTAGGVPASRKAAAAPPRLTQPCSKGPRTARQARPAAPT